MGDDVHTKNLQASTTAPTDCEWPEPTLPAQLSTTFDCESMTITLANPESAKEDVTLVLTPSTGEQRTLVVAPGKSGSATFAAGPGFKVDVKQSDIPTPPDGGRPWVISYEQPDGCDDGGEGAAAPPADGEGGVTLPVTGAAAGTAAAAAGTLLAGGVVLLVVARRKMTFTP